jgi:hypothetical protein
MAPVPGNAFLNRVIVRVHAATHSCLNQEAFELGAITLRLLSLLRCGQPADLDVATAAAFGCRFSKWQERNLERQSMLAWEFSKLIPDYDASVSHHRNENVQPTVSIRTAKERQGRVREMQSQKRRTQQESLCALPSTSARTDEAS